MQLVAAEDEVGELLQLLHRLRAFGPVQAESDPVHFLLIAQALDVLAVVGRIVVLLEGGLLVEALDEETFPLQVGEVQRAAYRVHALLQRPFLGRLEQGLGHLEVVDGVEPAEAGALLPVLLVRGLLDDGHDAAGDDAVFPSKEADEIAAVAVHVIRTEDLLLVHVKRRNEVRVPRVQVQREIQERLLLLLGLYLLDSDHFTGVLRGSRRPPRSARRDCRPSGCRRHIQSGNRPRTAPGSSCPPPSPARARRCGR